MAFQGQGCASPNVEEASYLNKIAGPPSCSVLPSSGNNNNDRNSRPRTKEIAPAPIDASSQATDTIILEISPDKISTPVPCPPEKKATYVPPPPKLSYAPPPKRKPPAKTKYPAKKKSASVQVPPPSSCNLRKEEEVCTKKCDKKGKKKSKGVSPSASGGSSRGSSPVKKRRRV